MGRLRLDAHAAAFERILPPLQGDDAVCHALGLDLTEVRPAADMQGFDIFLRHGLQPDRLPDARAGGIPHAAALPALFASGKLGREVVHDADFQPVFAVPNTVCDVGGKGKIGLIVPDDLRAVDADNSLPADRTEVQQDSSSPPGLREAEGALIVHPLTDLRRPGDPAQQTFGAKGHPNRRNRSVLEAQRPGPVQAEPLPPLQLRPGIAVPRDFGKAEAFCGKQLLHAIPPLRHIRTATV